MSEYLVGGEVIQVGQRLPPTDGFSALRGLRVSSVRMLAPPELKPDLSGHGYFAGTFPDGITSVEGVPTSLDVRVLYRPEGDSEIDGYLVAKTTSNPDGTWLVEGLNPYLKYDVICRHEGYNDMILSNVSPALATGLEFYGEFSTLESTVEILLGAGPYLVDVVDGAMPTGVEIQVAGDVMALVGKPEEWGQFSFVVRVIDSVGLSGVFASELEAEEPIDPHWDDVVSLLHFDGDLIDQKGNVISPSGGSPVFDSSNTLFGNVTLAMGNPLRLNYSGAAITTEDFTFEFFYFKPEAAPWRNYEAIQRRSGSASTGFYIQAGRVRPYGFGSLLTGALPKGVWTHLAICRSGSVWTAFVNGVKEPHSFSHNYSILSSTCTLLSDNYGQPLVMNVSNLRITKGVARYTENFTPPTEPFPNRGP